MKAPWTAEQVAALNEYQHCDWVHPFTCAHRDDHPVVDGEKGRLVATPDGWVCLQCGYTQDWCHDHMLAGAPPDPARIMWPRPPPGGGILVLTTAHINNWDFVCAARSQYPDTKLIHDVPIPIEDEE